MNRVWCDRFSAFFKRPYNRGGAILLPHQESQTYQGCRDDGYRTAREGNTAVTCEVCAVSAGRVVSSASRSALTAAVHAAASRSRVASPAVTDAGRTFPADARAYTRRGRTSDLSDNRPLDWTAGLPV
jgi:hypothetical protein